MENPFIRKGTKKSTNKKLEFQRGGGKREMELEEESSRTKETGGLRGNKNQQGPV